MEMNLIGPEEAGKLLKVKKTTIYKWASNGTIPVIHIGNTVRFDQASLIEWLRDKQEGGK